MGGKASRNRAFTGDVPWLAGARGEGDQQEAARAATSRDIIWNMEGHQRGFAGGETSQKCSSDNLESSQYRYTRREGLRYSRSTEPTAHLEVSGMTKHW